MKSLRFASALLAFALGACMTAPAPSAFPNAGTIHMDSPALAALMDMNAPVEKLAEGFIWSEGPVWISEGDYLLLSDVPANVIFRWSERDGLSEFLRPSGYAGNESGIFREPGSNGLIRGPYNSILMADHGSRAVARLDLGTKTKTFLADRYQGKRFNSPNDLVLAKDGSIWFTDPPYGLEGLNQSPIKELPFNGVYRRLPSGDIRLVDDKLTFPNGIILSPDERTLYVAVSDPEAAIIWAYALDTAGEVKDKRVFADMTALSKQGLPGLPDGMAIDARGNLFATGPGGVHVFSSGGQRLGRIDTGKAIANATFGEDGHSLFLASDDILVRVRTKTKGLGY
jgi:gluconolactonase